MKSRLHLLKIYCLCLCTDLVLRYLNYMMIEQDNGKYKTYLQGNVTDNLFSYAEGKHSMYETLYFDSNIFNISTETKATRKHKKIIMLYNEPTFLVNVSPTNKRYKNCEYKNCIFTRDMNKLFTAHAIIFYVGIRDERMGTYPPIQQTSRNPDQVWIFTAVESPEHYYNTDYRLSSWHNTMNWSSLYRLDSDIPIPYGILIRQSTREDHDYMSIYNMKTKTALWYVSHCQVASGRRLYVKEMIRNGLDVDIYGGCGSEGKRTKTNQTEFELTIPKYKFYLAFENSFCNDYITEKFFRNYNLNWILIARGGAEYHKLLPSGTFINTADFPDIPSLVQYLIRLGNDREEYINFLRRKDRYTSLTKHSNQKCEICRRLNNLSSYRKTYETIDNFINLDQCRSPPDL